MTDLQRLTVRASEIRQRLNEIAGLADDAMTDEVRAESDKLTAEYPNVETQLRAAVAAGDPPETRVETVDPEVRERINLRGRASLGAFLHAAIRGREPSGVEAEYREACGVSGIPIDLFEVDRPAAEEREREARAVTPAPSTGTGVTVAPVQPFVFAPSVAPTLGIEMPSVASGSYSELTITTSVPAGPKAKGGALAVTAGALTPTTAGPRRIGSRMSLSLEDVAAVGQANFEAALRANVSMALSDALDSQILNGNGTSPNINGLINQLTDPANPTAVADFDAFVSSASGQIDGLWASMLQEIGIIVNVDAFKLSARTFRGMASAGGPAVTAADYLAMAIRSWRTSKRMPATASTIARGIVHRLGRPGYRTACLPTWGSISVDDIYSNAGEGQRHFTVSSMIGDKVLVVQPAAYGLVEFKVS